MAGAGGVRDPSQIKSAGVVGEGGAGLPPDWDRAEALLKSASTDVGTGKPGTLRLYVVEGAWRETRSPLEFLQEVARGKATVIERVDVASKNSWIPLAGQEQVSRVFTQTADKGGNAAVNVRVLAETLEQNKAARSNPPASSWK